MEGGEERAHLDLGRAWIEGEGEDSIFIPPWVPAACSLGPYSSIVLLSSVSKPLNSYQHLQTHTHTYNHD